MEHFDLCVIGAGSGGLVAATTGNRLGLKTIMVEKHKIGGECTHSGCIPSKALISAAKSYQNLQETEKYGLPRASLDNEFDFGKVMAHVDDVIQGVYQHETPDVFEKMSITVVVDPAGARFLSPTHLKVGSQEFTATHTIICTGSSPRHFAPDGVENIDFLDNENFWQLRKQPKSITFIGGGVISTELGQTMRRFGSTVNIIEHNPRILKVVDDDVSALMIDLLEKDGVNLYHDTEILKCEKQTTGVRLTLRTPDGIKTLDSEAIFLAIGRVPNIHGLDLEKAGIEYSERGIVTNEFLQTSAENIYACGDVTSPAKFTHAASYQADICVWNIIKGNHKQNDLSVFPWAIFTDPEIAHVGLSEKQAWKKYGDDIQVLQVQASLDRFITELKTTGFIKIILDGEDKIIGADAIGAHAGEWIQLITMAIKHNISVEAFADTIVAYPTFSEIVKKAFVRHLRTKD